MTIETSTLFLVDGDAASRESVQALVAPMGIATDAFSSAEDFLRSYDGCNSGCLVTELRMAGMSGLELLESLKEQDTPLPTIVLTGFADVQSTVEAMHLGAFTLLEKPCRDSQLWDAIRKALLLDERQQTLRQRKQELCSRIARFTDRERQVMNMLVEGLPNKTIAARLGLSLRTIELRRKNVFHKMETGCVAELVSLVREAKQPICSCSLTSDQ